MKLLILLSALVVQEPSFPDVDPYPAIAAATRRAAAENRRVFVVWGMNDPKASSPLPGLLTTDKQIARLILYEYEVVLADIRRMKKGEFRTAVFPLLDILDAEGRLIAGTGGFTDAKRILEFLRKHVAPPVRAKDIMDGAMKRADKEQKRVLLTFGAPWCDWCRRFEGWMAREDAAPLHKEYVVVKVDVERMIGGQEVMDAYPRSKGQGLPWFVFLQPDGKELGDSTGPNGNIGCPNGDDEIDAFLAIVKKIAVTLNDDDLAALRKSLLAHQVKKE